MLYSISYPFIDWIVRTCKEASAGYLTDANVHDERNLDMDELVKKSLQDKLGYCCAVSKASINPTYGTDPDDTVQRCTVKVAILRNALFCKTDTTPLAEHLYTRFSAGSMGDVPGIGTPDVGARNFRATVTKGGTIDEFEVYYDIQND